jgi:hypothetical protein
MRRRRRRFKGWSGLARGLLPRAAGGSVPGGELARVGIWASRGSIGSRCERLLRQKKDRSREASVCPAIVDRELFAVCEPLIDRRLLGESSGALRRTLRGRER